MTLREKDGETVDEAGQFEVVHFGGCRESARANLLAAPGGSGVVDWQGWTSRPRADAGGTGVTAHLAIFVDHADG